ncbi:MAG: shikimate dehydrogenase [Candidatus Sumerlaeaceae bacterium]|nr:shikimate dehydrogenase [Candidatus Sumerlaeaceae bacterium]
MTGGEQRRIVGIIGHPISHSLSPLMHNAEFRRLGMNWEYRAVDVPPEKVGDTVKSFRAEGIAGFNVTIPHKLAVMEFLDEITPEALLIGAVNTVQNLNGRFIGHNTDMAGWRDDIEQDIPLAGRKVCLIGAGGAARAIAVGTLKAGAATLRIIARRAEAAARLAADLAPMAGQCSLSGTSLDNANTAVSECEVLVNTTPVGMAAHPGIPIRASWITRHHYVYDSIYVPAETELLKAARLAGARTRNGLGMLARQGAAAFEIWTGMKPDATAMEATLRAHLKA